MKYYIAALLLPDGTRHPVDRGGSVYENTALRVAVNLANTERHDACVVELDSMKQTETIVQRVRFKNDIALGDTTSSQSTRFMLSPLPLTAEAIEFVTGWLQQGRTVSLSPARAATEPSVNIVASST